MTFVTRLDFQSGDRDALAGVVADLKELLERKGAECTGPHSEQPRTLSVPQYRRLQPGDQYEAWNYTVYARWMEIHGADEVAREVGHMDFPDSVHVEIEVDQKNPLGGHN